MALFCSLRFRRMLAITSIVGLVAYPSLASNRDLVFQKVCEEALPDILPDVPFTTSSLWTQGDGTPIDALGVLRTGIARASFTVTQLQIDHTRAIPLDDPDRWSQKPLSSRPGTVTFEVVKRGDARCAAFELELEAAKNSKAERFDVFDPMNNWTFGEDRDKFPDGRNWCVATLESPDENAIRLTTSQTSTQGTNGRIVIHVETLAGASGEAMARRTIVSKLIRRKQRNGLPVRLDCNGQPLRDANQFFGPDGIALRTRM